MLDFISTNWKILRKNYLLPCLVLSAFFLRISLSDPVASYLDSTIYLSFAKAILKGHFFFDFVNGEPNVQQPLYPLFTALLNLLTDSVEQSAVIISVLFGSLLILPVFFFSRALYGEKAAWLTSLMIFLDPILVYWSTTILTEPLFIFLFLTVISLSYLAVSKDKRYLYLLTGIVAGLCYLTRVIGIIAVLIPILSVLLLRKNPRQNCRGTLIPILMILIGAFVIMAPHLLYLHFLYGEWKISGFSPYGGIIDVLTRTSFFPPSLKPLAEKGHGGVIIARVIYFIFLWSKLFMNTVPIVIVFACVGGLPRRCSAREASREFYIISCILLYGFMLILFAHETAIDDSMRLISPMVPLFIILAANGVIRLSGWIVSISSSNQMKLLTKHAFIIFSMIFIFLSLSFEFNQMREYYRYVRAARRWVNLDREIGLEIKKKLPDRPRIMVRKPWLVYYADGIWFSTPDMLYKEVIAYARSRRIDYLLVDSRVDPGLRPKIAFLLDPGYTPPELELVDYTVPPPYSREFRIMLYRIRKDNE